ncbi:hypothetical protein GCM10023108_49900 [Saccharopolyspora hordei]
MTGRPELSIGAGVSSPVAGSGRVVTPDMFRIGRAQSKPVRKSITSPEQITPMMNKFWRDKG